MKTTRRNSWLLAGWTGMALVLSGCRPAPAPLPIPKTGENPAPPVKPSDPRIETIYFLKGNASVSPGAMDKLRRCVTSWGLGGRWTLASPSNPDIPSNIKDDRIMALRTELQDLGVQNIESRVIPEESIGKYDAVYIVKEAL